MPELERYENIQNKLCMARVKASEKVKSPGFSLDESEHAVSELAGVWTHRAHSRGLQKCS